MLRYPLITRFLALCLSPSVYSYTTAYILERVPFSLWKHSGGLSHSVKTKLWNPSCLLSPLSSSPQFHLAMLAFLASQHSCLLSESPCLPGASNSPSPSLIGSLYRCSLSHRGLLRPPVLLVLFNVLATKIYAVWEACCLIHSVFSMPRLLYLLGFWVDAGVRVRYVGAWVNS